MEAQGTAHNMVLLALFYAEPSTTPPPPPVTTFQNFYFYSSFTYFVTAKCVTLRYNNGPFPGEGIREPYFIRFGSFQAVNDIFFERNRSDLIAVELPLNRFNTKSTTKVYGIQNMGNVDISLGKNGRELTVVCN